MHIGVQFSLVLDVKYTKLSEVKTGIKQADEILLTR
jgi:hypothetical protein